MKTKFLTAVPLAVIAFGTLAMPVSARDDHGRDRDRDNRGDHRRYYDRDHHRYYYGHAPRWNFGFGFYSAPRYYYEPEVVYTRPVYVERPVYVSRSVEADVQSALAHRRYYGGPIDGDIGPRTRAAIRAYQVDRGLPVTGVIDRPLLKSLDLL